MLTAEEAKANSVPESKRVTVTIAGDAYEALTAEANAYRSKGIIRSWGELTSTALLQAYGKTPPDPSPPRRRKRK